MPKKPAACSITIAIKYVHLATSNHWQLINKNGKQTAVRLRCKEYSSSGKVLREGAIAGIGIALLPTFIVGQALKSGQLVQTLTDYYPPPITAYLGYAVNRHLSTKIQL